MLKKRVIPTLLYKDNILVKGKNFLSNRPVLPVIESVKVYDLREVDELIFYDVMATKKNTLPDFSLITDISKECFVPLVVGGGIKDLKTIEKLLRCGADKVSINSHAAKQPEFLLKASKEFGSQCIVACLDFKKSESNNVFINCGSTNISMNIFEMSKIYEQTGCGEITISSIDNDGTLKGYDLEVISKIKKNVKTPIIASGGCGCYEDMYELFFETNVEAAAAASIFHFSKMTPRGAKKYLKKKEINVRI